MTIATRKFTWAEYLSYDDGTDTCYELVDGALIPIAVGTGRHGNIAKFLEQVFDAESARLQNGCTAQRFAIAVRSPRGGRWDTARIPDVVVLPIAQWEAMADTEAVIELNTPPPLLVVEVVSESTVSTDYRSKYTEYAVLDILEYWIADPLKQQVTICQWEEGRYDDLVFQGDQAIESKVFPDLSLTATQILTGKL
jgi:Uma2 family endonuclease